MAKSFSSTDQIVTGLTSHSNVRTYSMWVYRNGTGADLGRMFDKRDGSDSQSELLFNDVQSSTFTDTFSGTSGTALESTTGWTKNTASQYQLEINASGEAEVTTNGTGTSLATQYFCTPQGADSYVQADIINFEIYRIQLFLRYVDSNNYVYWTQPATGSAGSRLYSVIGGSYTQLEAFQGSAGMTIRLEAQGTTYRIYKDGVQQGSDHTISDASLSTSTDVQGIYVDTSTGDPIDNFEAGSLGGGSNLYVYERARSSSPGNWSCTAPSADAWHHVLVTYDSSSTTNDPAIYIDGVAQTVTENSTPAGTVVDNTSGYVIGNRGNDSARTWDGYLAEFATWDRILSAEEIAALANGISPLFMRSQLLSYVPIIREVVDFRQINPTVTGTTTVDHPRIIYPRAGVSFAGTQLSAASNIFLGDIF